MTAQQAAGVVIRMFALWWLVDSTFYFIDVPSELMGILHYRTLPNGGTALDQFFALQREIGLGLIVFKGLVFFTLGVGFMIFARPIARLLARGME